MELTTEERRRKGRERQTSDTIELTKRVIKYPEPQIFEICSQLSCISVTCKSGKKLHSIAKWNVLMMKTKIE